MARITHDDFGQDAGHSGDGNHTTGNMTGHIIDTVVWDGQERIDLPDSGFVQQAEILRDGQDLLLQAPEAALS